MALTPGTRLGPYDIVALLGAGGMGEVYRATDSNLKRSVAIKVLPASVAGDADRLARFQREAEVLAALNHPNIAAIYGLEKTPDFTALIMELVDGEDLSQRLSRGAVATDEALPIAKQIADALEAAHEQGVIHRDLKPANIKVRADGTVKVLDFGLAKAMEPAASSSPGLSMSPTITTPAVTQAGMILGTAAYMSPEQARGKTVDKRADIWAFGCVLYEMLTGTRAFQAEDVSLTLAEVMKSEPDWSRLTGLPPALRTCLRRCLAKDPRQRIRDIGDVRLALDDGEQPPEASSGPAASRRVGIVWTIAAVLAAAATAATVTWLASHRPTDQAPAISHFSIALPADAPLDVGPPWGSVAISRDGRTIAFIAQASGDRQLYLRRADDLVPHAVTGASGAWEAFFSPDGQWLAFVAADRLKKVAITGGQPQLIADAANLNSGVWADDGSIYLGGRAGLVRVAPDGKVAVLAKPQPSETELGAPDLLPDGSLLFTIKPNDVVSFDDARIGVLTTLGERRVVLEGGSYARYAPTGHLVYARGGDIMAVPFDVRRLAVSGQPAAVTHGGMFNTLSGVAHFGISRTGVLVYAPGGPVSHDGTLAWIDRHGAVTPIQAPPRNYAEPAISPDGRQIAFDIRAANDDIWVYDIARSTFSRLTFTHGNNQVPIWSRDGTRVVYGVDRLGVRRLAWRPVDGSGAEELLTPAQFFQTPGSWSPDGKLLAYTEDRPATGGDIYLLSVEGDRTPRAFLTTPIGEHHPMFSPDGHWVAFDSDETGHLEVFVTPFPGPGRKWQISSGGGWRPAWTRNGREIVYANGDQLMAVAVAPASSFQAGSPRELVKLPARVSYFDMTPDGERFLLVQRAGPDAAIRELDVVLNWFEELRARVPAK